MRYVIGRMIVRPGRREEYLERSAAYVALSRTEPGCVYYDLSAVDGDADGVTLIECWASPEAHAAHLARPEREAAGPPFTECVLSATFEEMDVAGITPIVVDFSKP